MTMDRYVITGKQRLEGRVRTSGAKNASLPLIAATIMAEGKTVLQGVPQLTDIINMTEVLKTLGCKTWFADNELVIDTSSLKESTVDEELMRKMRASNLILGPMIAKNGRVKISRPGGCAIGTRPMDQHIKGLKELGVLIHEKHGYIEAVAEKLRGGEIYLDIPSVGATENN
jgi:UDP-N-acetylglucosamine 1-carboxyvinyltransferase